MYNPKPAAEPEFNFPLQCLWLKLNGSWPLSTPHWYASVFNFFYSLWSWYVIVSVAVTIGYEIAFLVHIFGDIAQTTENCCTTFMGVLNLVRLLHLRCKRDQFRRIIGEFVHNIWIVRHSHPSEERQCARTMRIYRFISVLLTCLIALYCLMPLIERALERGDNRQPFPYKMLFPYDAYHGGLYVFTYVFTAYAGVCVVTTLFAEDSIFGLFITYTCGQFRILHCRIDALMPEAAEWGRQAGKDERQAYEAECLRMLARIARRHNQLVQFARNLESFFSPILLVNFGISSILIGMVGFQLATGKNMFIGDYIKFLVYLSSSLMQLYVLCWNGDMLIKYAADTAQHLYACHWEGGVMEQSMPLTKTNKRTGVKALRVIPYQPASKAFRHNLQLMIMYSQRPVCITAMKFSTLSLSSFSTLISTSMSYFALLKSFYDDGES